LTVNIDLKHDNEELVGHVNNLVVEYKREDITIWGSTRLHTRNHLKEINPRVPRFFSLKQVVVTFILYIFGLVPFCSFEDSFFEIPLLTPRVEGFIREHTSASWKLSVALFIGRFFTTRKWLFNHLRKRGIHVVMFVLNTPEEFEQAFHLGAHAIMTDYPTRLKQYLDTRGHSLLLDT
jgi:lysophospholipase D